MRREGGRVTQSSDAAGQGRAQGRTEATRSARVEHGVFGRLGQSHDIVAARDDLS
jgi:hypothetical protein